MLRYTEFDLKTGQVLTERDFEGNEVAREKRVEHSYLEHWLKVNNLPDANLWMAKFYEGVNNSDRIENEAQGRVLVFSNARKGYFADPDTARVMIHGDEAAGIRSIYADDRSSPHNLAAYGSLLAAGGIASSTQEQARILVIDNERWSHGDQPLIDRFGQTVPAEELVKLYRKMGDGTMLTSSQIMLDLITEKERERIASDVFKRAGIDTRISGLTTLEPEVEAASQRIEQKIMQLAQRKVTQFRAGSPDLPGLIKGTMATSQWCDRLGVDLIVSSDDIKGANSSLLEPGIKSASDLFVNRMTDAAYGYQMIGPQVKACIPEATLHEFNPKIEERAQRLYEIASDPKQLLAYYVEKQERRIDDADEEADEANPKPSLDSDWLYQIAKADEYGAIEEAGKVNTTLERFLRTERVNTATRGVEVESATAQAHELLKPWEVCNKDLEHGALLFYMRSPFPNIGVAAIAINNLEVIKQEDREAFGKDGVIYLPICQYGDAENPKHKLLHVPITDCDGDRNGCFRGYSPTIGDLPEQIRAELSLVGGQSPLVQYEAARALFGEMVAQLKSGQESRIEPDLYPIAVAEAIERTAPEVKPPEIYKQPKVKHPWNEGESHSAALWRAWELTANNPTGMCANVGMTLQALALETHYISDDKKETLLRQISAHYQKLLNKFDDGKLAIPSDEDLVSKNLPSYRLIERIAEVARANIRLMRITEPEQRKAFVQAQLEAAGSLLMDLANGPAAMNLQTAVDNLKSSVGIDKTIHDLLEKIAHKENKIQSSKKDSGVYLSGKQLETSTEEPISWGVRIANQFYRDSKLPERPHLEFSYIMPRDFMASESREIEHIGRSYNAAIKQINSDEEKAKQDGKIHLLVCTTVADKQIKIFCDDLKIYDECNADFWWKLGNPRDVQIRLEQGKYGRSNEIIAYFQLKQLDKKSEFSPPRRIGAVSEQTQNYSDLLEKVKAAPIVISLPQLRLIAPKIIDNSSTEDLRKDARRLRDEAIAQLPEARRYNYACAAWHDTSTMKLALQYFVPELAAAVQNLPKIRVQGLELQGNETGKLPDGEYTIRVQELSYQKKTGETVKARAIAVVIDDEPKTLGTIYSRSIKLPIGTMAQAHISSDGNYADVQFKGRLREVEASFNSREQPPILPEAAQEQPLLAQAAATVDQSSIATDSALLTSTQTPDQSAAAQISQVLTIATDGACSGNPGPGGWSAILVQGEIYQELGGAVEQTTNNRMEMLAVIEALKVVKASERFNEQMPITIISDSQLVIKGATGEWKRNANLDLWAEYDQAASGLELQFEWIKGHSGHELNERADVIAVAFAQGKLPELRDSSRERANGHSQPVQHATATSEPSPSGSALTGGQAEALEVVHPAGKRVQMVFPLKLHGEANPLPVDSCIEAMRGYGRCHTTRVFEPYAAYGFQAGDIAIAYAGEKQVAFRVGEQYRITPEMIADSTYRQQWAEMEKHSPQELLHFQIKSDVWGLKMEPLGDFINGKIQPFPVVEPQSQQSTSLPALLPQRQDLHIISGGQSGADLGGLLAAQRLGIPTGVDKHGLSGGAASQLSSDSTLILPPPLPLKTADLARLAAPNIVAVTELSALSPQRSTPTAQAASPEPTAQIAKPVNIYSGSPDGLGAALTNPTELSHHKGRIVDHYPVTFQGERWPDAEAAYQHHKSSTQIGPERETLMSAILQAKLEQHPKLTAAIERRGGSEWIQSCEHTVNRSGGSYWEGKGQESAFLRCLSDAYSNVKAAEQSENGKRSGDRLTSTSAPDSSYSPTRGELLHWMEIAKIADQGERQMQIRTLGLELKRQYLQHAGDGAAEIPRDYRHPSVTISTEDRQHFTNQISIIRNALQQMNDNAKLDALPSACER